MSNCYKFFVILIIVTSPAWHITAQDTLVPGSFAQMMLEPTPEQARKIDAAFTAMEAVQQASAYIESLSDLIGNGEITLPVGIKKGPYELIIQRITHNQQTHKPRIYATCAFKFKDSGQRIAFEGSVDMEGQKGLGTSGYLSLITPVKREIGKQAVIVFKRGTKAIFGCDGIESYDAKMLLVVTSDKVVAVDKEGNPTDKLLATNINTKFSDFDNYTASFSFNQSFMFKGLNDVYFTLKGATIDQSDLKSPPIFQFPPDYFSGADSPEVDLWRGVTISEATITLPGYFNKTKINRDSLSKTADSNRYVFQDRIALNLSNVILDNNGFSAGLVAEGIIPNDALDKSKWDLSLTDLIFGISKNNFKEFGIGGDVNIPPLGKSSLVPYQAIYRPSIEEFEFTANLKGEYDFPVLRSTLTLDETSTIELLFKEHEIYPTLVATGKISVDAPLSKNDTTKKFQLPDVNFENMKISREEPYLEIGAIGLTGDIKSPKVAGFELYISNIRSFYDANGSGLAFDAGVKLSSMFGGEAGLQLYGDYMHWQFDRVNVDKVKVEYKSGAFSIYGGVMFKNGDEIYGTGFRGELGFELIKKFKFDAVAIFGKKEDFRYFLTDVYFETSPTAGITIPPALSFYGFGGGLYRRMQQSYDPTLDSDFGKSLSGINYIPDNTVGMGFMTTTKFGLIGSESGFNAKVGFEIQFNRHGGLNFIQLRGDAAFMDAPGKWGKLSDNITKKVKQVENAGGKLKLASKTDLKVPENKSSGFLTASMNIKYDFANKIFTADLSTYLNAGVLTGVGPNNRMGWASAYFSKDKWYTYIGTPYDRLGVKILGLVTVDGYFMIGDDIPELPPPPYKVLKNFSPEKQEKLTKRSADNLTSGSGVAFGQSFSIAFAAQVPPFYADLGVGMGGEFVLKNYGVETYCAGGSTTIGINGWYAQAQAWAWVNADIGMEATVFKQKRQFSILDISAGALLKGAGPNPIYFTGMVGGQFNALGGLVSGQCEFDFEIGEECEIFGGSPFGEDIIAQVTPTNGEKDVNVFASPQALFNIPVELELEVEETEGKKAWYKITLENFSVYYKDTKQKVAGNTELSPDKKVIMLDPHDPLESHKDLVVLAKVGLKRRLNGEWINVKDEAGEPLYEIREEVFTSGERPKEILPEHVKYSYPVNKQYNFYPKEYDKGYILVTENYSYLFSTEKPEGFDQVLRFTDIDENKKETSFSYKTNSPGNDIRLELSYSMKNISFRNDEIYKLSIVNVPKNANNSVTSNITTTETNLGDNDNITVTQSQAEGTLDMLEEKEVYALHFRTSAYNTFIEKITSINSYEGVVWQEYPHVYLLGSNIYDGSATTEVFDQFENNTLIPENSMVKVAPLYEQTAWYNRKVAPLMYNNSEMLASANMAGLTPPDNVDIVKFSLRSSGNKLSDDMIKSNTRAALSSLGAYNYRAPYYVDRDYVALRNALANRIVSGQTVPNGTARFLNSDHIPDITNGDYEVQLSYTLPGKDIVTSTINRTIELDGFLD